MLFSPPQNVNIQIDKYFRHGNACFKGLDCTAYTKQHMTQIDFTRNSQERFAGTRVNDQEATKTEVTCTYFLEETSAARRRPPTIGFERARLSYFRKKVPGDTTTKLHTGVTKDLSKFASRIWTPPCPHRFLQSFFGILSRVWSSVDL